jgi:hypothetical protein
MAYQGYFKPKNLEKYMGDPTKIVYRSGWELKFMSYLDSHANVVNWSSEEFFIPYRSPMDNRIHRYFPDFLVKKRTPEGLVETIVVEVKPASQSRPPKPVAGKPSKTYLREVYNWGINSSKWESANKYCSNRGWKFIVIGEKELGIKF